MKKIIFLLIILCLLVTGCENKMKQPEFTEIEWAGIDWEQIEISIDTTEMEFDIDGRTIVSKEDAIEIGEIILEKFHEKNKFKTYVLLAVVHSTKDNIWRFEYAVDERDKNVEVENIIFGDVGYVAVNGDNCEIIKAWIEE